MIIDAFFMFTGGTQAPGNSDGKTDSPTTGTQVSSNVIDLGVGINNSTNIAIPSLTAGGGARDMGIGDDPALKLLVDVEVAFLTGTSLQVNLQGAPESGTTVQTPGSYTTMYTGPVVLLASLIIGARLADIDLPRPVPGQPVPRYLQLQYVEAGSAMTAGKLLGAFVLDRHDQPLQSNAVLGGYPPGITIAN